MLYFKKKKTGFSLIELSVVILIISILAAGAISVSGTFLINAKTKQTRDKMEAIYKAIGTYVAKNHHLPCPAPLTDTKSDAGYGQEGGTAIITNTARVCGETGAYSSNDVTGIVYGMVPVNSLGLSDDMAEDGFGSRFSYVVNQEFTSPNYSSVTTFTEGFSHYPEVAADMIQIYQSSSGNVITNVSFAIISHGQNKLGAYNANSATQNSVTGISTQEGYNVLSSIVSATATFGTNASHAGKVTFTSSDSDDDFDDTILYKTKDEIISDFDLGYLYYCDTVVSGYNQAYSGQLEYGSICGDLVTYPSKECGPRGESWIDRATCSP